MLVLGGASKDNKIMLSSWMGLWEYSLYGLSDLVKLRLYHLRMSMLRRVSHLFKVQTAYLQSLPGACQPQWCALLGIWVAGQD